MTPPTTKSFLTNWTLTIPPEDGRQPRMVGTLRTLEKILGEVQGHMPSIQDAKESLKELEEGWERGLEVASLPKRHLRQFAWALFQPWAREGLDLPANGPFVSAYRDWLTKNRSGAKAARLIPPYLRYFPEDGAFREDWRQFLADVLDRHPGRRLAVWKDRHKGFGLLEVDGTGRIASLLIQHPGRYEELLERAGLTGFLADSRFVRIVHGSLIQQVSQELRSNPDLSRGECDSLLSVLELSTGELRFGDLRVDVAEALLAPWVDRTPPEPVKEAIRSFLHRNFGNPNVRKTRWSGVAPVLKEVLLRWLAEEALETFFQIVSETAKARHWEERKRFWENYLQEEMISGAWLALGGSAASLARTAFKVPRGAWAKLKGAQASQSVLLFQINNITVIEWSHEGAGRIWLNSNTNAPKLYRAQYSRNQFMGDHLDFRFVHIKGWQSETARWIQRETGLRPVSRGRHR